MLTCRKCGAELHPEQKVCIQCGERTAAGFKFDVEEEHHWRPSAKQVKIASAIVGVILLVLILHKVLYVVPPEQVAKEWFDAMVGRQLAIAGRLSSPALEQNLSSRSMDLRALSDQYMSDVTSNSATYQMSPPAFDIPSRPTSADITVTIKLTTGEPIRVVTLQLTKVGRAWRVSDAR